jgi:hypothetical protein
MRTQAAITTRLWLRRRGADELVAAPGRAGRSLGVDSHNALWSLELCTVVGTESVPRMRNGTGWANLRPSPGRGIFD